MADDKPYARPAQSRYTGSNQTLNQPLSTNAPRPFQKPQPQNAPQRPIRPEPTYQPVGLAAKSREDDPGAWR